MSKISELLQNQPSMPEHLTLSGILKDIGFELKHQAAHGAHEMAAALLKNSDGFVMYGRDGKDDQGHGLPQEASKQHVMDGPSM